MSRTLLIVHMGLAKFIEAPEMELDKTESDMLAASTVNVLEAFDVRPNPKAEAVFGLVTCAAMVYGPRVVTFRKRKAKVVNPDTLAEVEPLIFPPRTQAG